MITITECDIAIQIKQMLSIVLHHQKTKVYKNVEYTTERKQKEERYIYKNKMKRKMLNCFLNKNKRL